MRIIVIEDDDLVQTILAIYIKTAGHEPEMFFCDAAQFQNWLSGETKPIEVMITDCEFPGGGAKAVIEAYAQKFGPQDFVKTKILLTSGLDQSHPKVAGILESWPTVTFVPKTGSLKTRINEILSP